MIKRVLLTLALSATVGIGVAACNGSSSSPTIPGAESSAPITSPSSQAPVMSESPSMAPSESAPVFESAAPSAS